MKIKLCIFLLYLLIVLSVASCSNPLNNAIIRIDQKNHTTTEHLDTITGKIENQDMLKSLKYVIKTETDENSISSEGIIEVKDSSWSIPDIRLKPGENEVTITAESKTSEQTSKSIKINYDSGYVYKFEPQEIVKSEDGYLYIDNVLIIIFKQNVTEERIKEIIKNEKGQIVGQLNISKTYEVKFKVNGEKELIDMLKKFERMSEIVNVSFDNIYLNIFDSTVNNDRKKPNDPWKGPDGNKPSDWEYPNVIAGTNWGIKAIEADWAWNKSNYFDNIIIGIVDAPFDLTHEDLKDINCSIISDSNFIEKEDHGTHVLGIIGAKQDNGKGITGIVKNKHIFAYALSLTEEETEETDKNGNKIKAEYISKPMILDGFLKNVLAGAQIINFSSGDGGTIKTGEYKLESKVKEKDKLDFAYTMALLLYKEYDFLVVQSAGNGNADDEPVLASENGLFTAISLDLQLKYDNVFLTAISLNQQLEYDYDYDFNITPQDLIDRIIVVGAVDNKFDSDKGYEMTKFSNYGDRVDIVAPGKNILSTINDNKYGSYGGTSMAAPYVTGIAALVWQTDGSLNGSQIKNLICAEENTTKAYRDDPIDTKKYRMLNARLSVQAAIDSFERKTTKWRNYKEVKNTAKEDKKNLYYEYLNKVLVPKIGLSDVGEFNYINPNSGGVVTFDSDDFPREGILSVYIDDMDNDSISEMIVFSITHESEKLLKSDAFISVDLYSIVENEVILLDSNKHATGFNRSVVQSFLNIFVKDNEGKKCICLESSGTWNGSRYNFNIIEVKNKHLNYFNYGWVPRSTPYFYDNGDNIFITYTDEKAVYGDYNSWEEILIDRLKPFGFESAWLKEDSFYDKLIDSLGKMSEREINTIDLASINVSRLNKSTMQIKAETYETVYDFSNFRSYISAKKEENSSSINTTEVNKENSPSIDTTEVNKENSFSIDTEENTILKFISNYDFLSSDRSFTENETRDVLMAQAMAYTLYYTDNLENHPPGKEYLTNAVKKDIFEKEVFDYFGKNIDPEKLNITDSFVRYTEGYYYWSGSGQVSGFKIIDYKIQNLDDEKIQIECQEEAYSALSSFSENHFTVYTIKKNSNSPYGYNLISVNSQKID